MRAFALLSLVFVFVFVFVFACHPQLPGLVRGLVWCGWDLACVFARAVRAAFVALGREGVVGFYLGHGYRRGRGALRRGQRWGRDLTRGALSEATAP